MKKDSKGLNVLIGTGFIGSNLTQDRFDLKIDSRARMAYGTQLILLRLQHLQVQRIQLMKVQNLTQLTLCLVCL